VLYCLDVQSLVAFESTHFEASSEIDAAIDGTSGMDAAELLKLRIVTISAQFSEHLSRPTPLSKQYRFKLCVSFGSGESRAVQQPLFGQAPELQFEATLHQLSDNPSLITLHADFALCTSCSHSIPNEILPAFNRLMKVELIGYHDGGKRLLYSQVSHGLVDTSFPAQKQYLLSRSAVVKPTLSEPVRFTSIAAPESPKPVVVSDLYSRAASPTSILDFEEELGFVPGLTDEQENRGHSMSDGNTATISLTPVEVLQTSSFCGVESNSFDGSSLEASFSLSVVWPKALARSTSGNSFGLRNNHNPAASSDLQVTSMDLQVRISDVQLHGDENQLPAASLEEALWNLSGV
jgi:hypothetical protein